MLCEWNLYMCVYMCIHLCVHTVTYMCVCMFNICIWCVGVCVCNNRSNHFDFQAKINIAKIK